MSRRLFADVTFFYHQYSDLRAFELTPTPLQQISNDGEHDIYGGELSVTWRPMSDLIATLNYANNHSSSERHQRLEAELLPRHIASLHLAWDICPTLGADLTAYHVDDRNEDEIGGLPQFDDFTSLNLALRWRASPSVTLRLVGQDLLESSQIEGIGRAPLSSASYVPRGVYGDVTVNIW